MADKTIIIDNFTGGLSDDPKYANNQNSFSSGFGINFRKDLSKLKINRTAIKDSGTSVDTEVSDAVVDKSGNVYFAGVTKVYKRTPGANGATGTYSTITSAPTNCRDLDYRPDLDTLYVIDKDTVGTYAPLSGTPTYTASVLGYALEISLDGSGLNYTVGTTDTAASPNIPITIAHDPLNSCVFNVTAKGAGSLTCVVRTPTGVEIGRKTILNASISVGLNTFTFTNPLRTSIGSTYYIYLFSSAGGTSVQASGGTLPTAYFYATYKYLVDAGDFGHCVLQFGNKTLIGNERYLAEFEYNTTYDPHRLTFPSDCVVIGLTMYNQYVAIACARRDSSDSTSNTTLNSGYIFLWDGSSIFYESIIEVPFGVPGSMMTNENVLQFIANGTLYQWAGGDFMPVHEFSGVDEYDSTGDKPNLDIYLSQPRHGSTSVNRLSYYAFPGQTTNTNIKMGIYSYGSQKATMPRAVAYDYALSTGTKTTQLDTSTSPDSPKTKLFMLKSFGTNMFLSWLDGTTYGVDLINDSNSFNLAANWESLIIDDNKPFQDKQIIGVTIVYSWDGTTDNAFTITPYVILDDVTITGSDFSVSSRTDTSYGKLVFRPGMNDGSTVETSFKTMKVGFNIATGASATVSPIIHCVAIKYNDNSENEFDVEFDHYAG